MIEISWKRYGELVGSAVRVSELEQELARMTKNFEMQTENVQYWKSATEHARSTAYSLGNLASQQEKKIVELESALEDSKFKYNDAINELFKWQAAFLEAEKKLNTTTVELGNLKFRHFMAIEASERILEAYTNLGKCGAE